MRLVPYPRKANEICRAGRVARMVGVHEMSNAQSMDPGTAAAISHRWEPASRVLNREKDPDVPVVAAARLTGACDQSGHGPTLAHRAMAALAG
jgi:hypothetical protein